MRSALRQLDAACSNLNRGVLKTTPFGVGVERFGSDVMVIRKARRPPHMSMAGVIFSGDTEECFAFLDGLKAAEAFYRDGKTEIMPYRYEWPLSLVFRAVAIVDGVSTDGSTGGESE